MDHRLQNLSYSSLLTLHSCPRLFQLSRLQAERPEVDFDSSVTFAYGHLVGDGIQQAMTGMTLEEIFWSQYLKWEPDLFAENPKQVKSFWTAMFAVEKFIYMRASGFLAGWNLMYHNGVPATELSFRVTLPDGFKIRGFVDAVLQHEVTGAIMILEGKTSSAASLNPATYKNSAQAIGYSIVLDAIAPDASAYEVLYLVYKSKAMEFESLMFEKSYLQRALWIRELLLDVEMIKMYDEAGVFPMRGESCFTYYRECNYLGLCTLSTENLIDPPDPEHKVEEFQIELTLQDLIDSQLRKIS